MLPQTTPYTPTSEKKPDMPQPPVVAQWQINPEYNEQVIESLAQRLMPRLMPEILYNLRTVEPIRSRSRGYGMSLALAIVSLALMIPLTAIVLGIMTTTVGGGIGPALLGISIVGFVMVLTGYDSSAGWFAVSTAITLSVIGSFRAPFSLGESAVSTAPGRRRAKPKANPPTESP